MTAPDDGWARRAEEVRAVAATTPAEQAVRLLPALKLLLGRKLGTQYAHFERACQTGALSAYELHEGAVKTYASLEGEAFVSDLRRRLTVD